MSRIADLLREIINQKNQLVANLNAKGQTSTTDETFNTLVPKVLNIVAGDARLGTKTIIGDGVYKAVDDGLDGYSQVEVDALGGANGTITLTDTINGSKRYRNIRMKGDIPTYSFHGDSANREIELIDCRNVGAYAFYNNTACTRFTSDTPFKTISNYSFYYIPADFDISLDDNIEEIPTYCFYQCTKLNIPLPSHLKTVKARAFQGCSELEIAELPQGLANVETYGFYYCKRLTATVCPVITTMGTYAFSYSGVRFTEIPDGCVLGTYAFGYCDGLTDLTINIRGTIPTYCFQYCANLERVVFGENVLTINGYAFRNCNKIKTLVFRRTTPPSMTSTSFSNISNPERIEVPAASVDAYKADTALSKWADVIVGV